MKRLWNMIIRLCIAAVCGYGCSDDYTEIGNRWTEVNTRLIVIDTCTVEVSTAILDSIVTSGRNVIFAGIRESGYWGRTSLSTSEKTRSRWKAPRQGTWPMCPGHSASIQG